MKWDFWNPKFLQLGVKLRKLLISETNQTLYTAQTRFIFMIFIYGKGGMNQSRDRRPKGGANSCGMQLLGSWSEPQRRN